MSPALAGIFLITEPSRKPWLLLLTRFTEETETQRVLGKVTFAGFNGYETMAGGMGRDERGEEGTFPPQ